MAELINPIEKPEKRTPDRTKELTASYKEIQDGDILPGKTREESQAIYDKDHGQKPPTKEKK